MLDRDQVMTAFDRAVKELGDLKRASPRAVALKARAIYCAGLKPGEKTPSTETFRKYVAGKSAWPEVLAVLERAGVKPATRARLDRERLHAVFREAVQRLETRILKGHANPLQIARRAHELYNRDADQATLRPSHYTFRRMIYGKAADPEILTLIETALTKSPKKEGGGT